MQSSVNTLIRQCSHSKISSWILVGILPQNPCGIHRKLHPIALNGNLPDSLYGLEFYNIIFFFGLRKISCHFLMLISHRFCLNLRSNPQNTNSKSVAEIFRFLLQIYDRFFWEKNLSSEHSPRYITANGPVFHSPVCGVIQTNIKKGVSSNYEGFPEECNTCIVSL